MPSDFDALKRNFDLRDIAAHHSQFITKPEAKEQKGPCPKCGGEDRFYVQKAFFACRNCHSQHSDVIEFYQWLLLLYLIDLRKYRL